MGSRGLCRWLGTAAIIGVVVVSVVHWADQVRYDARERSRLQAEAVIVRDVVFEDQPVAEAARRLSAATGVSLVVDASIDADQRVSGGYSGLALGEVLDAIVFRTPDGDFPEPVAWCWRDDRIVIGRADGIRYSPVQVFDVRPLVDELERESQATLGRSFVPSNSSSPYLMTNTSVLGRVLAQALDRERHGGFGPYTSAEIFDGRLFLLDGPSHPRTVQTVLDQIRTAK